MEEDPICDTGGKSEEKRNYEDTEEEWDNVVEITPQFKDAGGESTTAGRGAEPIPGLSSLVGLGEVYTYLNSGILDPYLAQVQDPPKSSLDLMLNCMCPLRSLPPPHVEQGKQCILAAALIPYGNEESLHLEVLRTLYTQLTGARVQCPRYGHHWEDIGFQGNDPATDLRGVGFLGLVQALYLVTTQETLPFARDIYLLSLDKTQEFPLMVLSLNVTRICLHVLRDGLLDKQCYKDNDAWKSVNVLYSAVMFHIYHIWKSQHKTISNSGFVLKDAETNARKSPQNLIEEFQMVLKRNYSR